MSLRKAEGVSLFNAVARGEMNPNKPLPHLPGGSAREPFLVSFAFARAGNLFRFVKGGRSKI